MSVANRRMEPGFGLWRSGADSRVVSFTSLL